jgi:DnaJ-domain-containing protein 1
MYHPDRVSGLGPEFAEIAERKMKQINAAYEELQKKFA